jgi:nucleoside-diphosphate-sugar epimerase
MYNSGKRVLITGGSGFIGAALTRALIDQGHEVHLLLRPQSNLWRLAGLEHGYSPLYGDLLDLTAVEDALQACRPQVIYHLATHGGYAFQQDRTAILATNLLGTANLLTALEGCDYERLVNVGSSSEYGHKSAPMRETDTLAPRTDYAVSKAAATWLCQAEALRGRPVTTVRVFSAYGPGEDSRRLVPSVIANCLRREPPRVTSGNQPRDFIYIDDVVSLLQTAASCPIARGQVLHAGTGCSHTVREMVETIIDVSGSKLPPCYGALAARADEPETWVSDITHTTRLTGWKPRYDLRAGIERTWAWFANHATACAA